MSLLLGDGNSSYNSYNSGSSFSYERPSTNSVSNYLDAISLNHHFKNREDLISYYQNSITSNDSRLDKLVGIHKEERTSSSNSSSNSLLKNLLLPGGVLGSAIGIGLGINHLANNTNVIQSGKSFIDKISKIDLPTTINTKDFTRPLATLAGVSRKLYSHLTKDLYTSEQAKEADEAFNREGHKGRSVTPPDEIDSLNNVRNVNPSQTIFESTSNLNNSSLSNSTFTTPQANRHISDSIQDAGSASLEDIRNTRGFGKALFGLFAAGAALSFIGSGGDIGASLDFSSNFLSNITSPFRGMIYGNPLESLQNEAGLPILPNSGPTISGLSRRDNYVNGIRVDDPTEATYIKNDNRFDAGFLINAGIGAAAGYGTVTALDAMSRRLVDSNSRLGEAFQKTFESNYNRTSPHNLVFGRNFAPFILGAGIGVLGESQKPENQNLGVAAVAGGLSASTIGFFSMKEEIGPGFGKKLGVSLIGATGALTLLNKNRTEATVYNKVADRYNVVYSDTAKRIQEGNAQLPYDLHANPFNEEIIDSFRNRTKDFDVKRNYRASPNSYKQIESHLNVNEINNSLASQLQVPSYRDLPNYNLVESLPTIGNGSSGSNGSNGSNNAVSGVNTNTVEQYNSGLLSYQAGYILPMLGAASVSGFITSQIGKRFANKVEGPLKLISTYEYKVKYGLEGDRLITESFKPMVKGLFKGDSSLLQDSASIFTKGVNLKFQEFALATPKKLAVFTPLLFGTNAIFQQFKNQSIEGTQQRYSRNDWDGITSVYKESEREDINKVLDLQKYLLEGKVTRVNEDVLFYDGANIGYGFKDFLNNTEDKTLKALLYKTDADPEILRILERKGAIGGIGISGGGALSLDQTENIKNIFNPQESPIGYAVNYPILVARNEGLFTGIATITNPIVGSITNQIVTSLGIDQFFGSGGIEGNFGGNITNAAAFGAIGLSATALVSKNSRLSKSIGIVSSIVGLLLPTEIDDYFYPALKQQGSYFIQGPIDYARHQVLTEPSPTTNVTMGILTSGGLGLAAGAGLASIGKQGNRGANAKRFGIIGAGLSLGLNVASSFMGEEKSLLPKFSSGLGRFLTGGVDLRQESFSILNDGKFEPGSDAIYTHLHSKVLWNKSEVFLSTGNIGTVYRNRYGAEDQFNVALRIKGEHAQRLIGQLEKFHEFSKKVKPDTDPRELNALAEQMPDFILGGKGSNSIKKIVDFLDSTEGDVMISAPYLSLSDNPGNVERFMQMIETLEERGQNVTIIGQNPRGIKAGGRPDLSEKAYKRLIEAGVEIYNADLQSDALTHAKIIAADNKALITSHNFSKNSDEKVLEAGMIVEGREFSQAVKQSLIRFAINSEFEKVTSVTEGGLAAEHATDLLINPNMGSSFFYSRALYNNAQKNAGFSHRLEDYKSAGPLANLYKSSFYDKHGYNLEGTPGYIQQYDKELLTGGLGSMFNEHIAMPLGFGRLYQDERGLLGSVGFTLGKLLDRSLLYFSSSTERTGINSYSEMLENRAIGKVSDQDVTPTGFFSAIIPEAIGLAQASITSILFYVGITEPLNLIFSENFKDSSERTLNYILSNNYLLEDGKDIDEVFKRKASQGLLNYGSLDPIENRLNLLREYQRNGVGVSFFGMQRNTKTGGFLELFNPFYYINALDRRRSSLLLTENIIPIFDAINPYKSAKDRALFLNNVEGYIDELSQEVSLDLVKNNTLPPEIKNALEVREDLSKKVQSYLSKGNLVVDNLEEKLNLLFINENLNKEIYGNSLPSFFNSLDAFDSKKNSIKSDSLIEIERYLNQDIKTLRSRYGVNKAIDLSQYGLALMGLKKEKDGTFTNVEYLNIQLTNLGVQRAGKIARKIQDVLDETPLDFTTWKIFNSSKIINYFRGTQPGGYDRKLIGSKVIAPVPVIGDILSFDVLTDSIQKIVSSHTFDALNIKYKVSSSNINFVNKLSTGLSIFYEYPKELIKRNWTRFKYLTGIGMKGPGLLSGGEASKMMEFYLIAKDLGNGQRGIAWGDDPTRKNLIIQRSNALADTEYGKFEKEIANRLKSNNLITETELQSFKLQKYLDAQGGAQRLNFIITNLKDEQFVKDISKTLNLKEGAEDVTELVRFINNNNKNLKLGITNRIINISSDPEISSISRRLNVVDDNVIESLRKMNDIKQQLISNRQAREVGFSQLNWLKELRDQQMGILNEGVISGRKFNRYLDKVNLNKEIKSIEKRGKLSNWTSLLSVLAIGVTAANNFFQSSQGVGLFRQLYTGLRLAKEDVGVNTEYDANRLGLMSILGLDEGWKRQVGAFVTTTLTLSAASIFGISSLREEFLEYSVGIDEFILKNQQKNAGLFVKTGDTFDFLGDFEGLKTRDEIKERFKQISKEGGLLHRTNKTSVYFGDYEVEEGGNKLLKTEVNKLIEFKIKGNNLVFEALRFSGNAYRNTAMGFVLINTAFTALAWGASTALRTLRNNDLGLDPVAASVILAGVTLSKTNRMPLALAAGAVGFIGGAISNWTGFKILDLGNKGRVVDNLKASIISDIKDYRNVIVNDLDKASRIELMSGIWANQMLKYLGDPFEQKMLGSEVKVSARQVTTPIVQLFLSRREVDATEYRSGNVTYTMGIQGPPITGASFSVQLPFKYSSNKGPTVFGFTFRIQGNEEYDLFDLTKDIAGVTTTLSMISAVAFATSSAVEKAGKKTQMFDLLIKGTEELSDFIFTNSSRFVSTLSRLGTSLYVTDYKVASEMMQFQNVDIDAPKAIKGTDSSNLRKTFQKVIQNITWKKGIVAASIGLTAYNFADFIWNPEEKVTENFMTSSLVGIGAGIGGMSYLNYLSSISTNKFFVTKDIAKPNVIRTGLRKIKGLTSKAINKISPSGKLVLSGAYKQLKGIGNSVIRGRGTPYLLSLIGVSLLTSEGFGLTKAMGFSRRTSSSNPDEYMDTETEAIFRGATTLAATTAIWGTAINLGTSSFKNRSESQIIEAYIALNKFEPKSANPESNVIRKMFDKIHSLYIGFRQKEADSSLTEILDAVRRERTKVTNLHNYITGLDPDSKSSGKIPITQGLMDFYSHVDENFDGEIDSQRVRKALLDDNDLVSKLKGGTKVGIKNSTSLAGRRLIKSMGGILAASIVTNIALSGLSAIGGKEGDWTESILRGLDNAKGPDFIRGISQGIADTIRLLTWKDNKSINAHQLDTIYFADINGWSRRADQTKLLTSKMGGADGFNLLVKEVQEMVVLDEVNTFTPFGPGGATFRASDTGYDLSPYLQLQGSGSDISTAAYMMVSRFHFKEVAFGKDRLYFEMQQAVKQRNEDLANGKADDISTRRQVAEQLLTLTARLQPLTKPRKISTVNSEVLKTALSNSLVTLSLAERRNRTKNLSYQPVESMLTRILIQQYSTNRRFLDVMMEEMLKGGNSFVEKFFNSDPYSNIDRQFNILQITFGPGSRRATKEKDLETMESIFDEFNSIYKSHENEDVDVIAPISDLASRLVSVGGPLILSIPFAIGGSIGLNLLNKMGGRSKALELDADFKRLAEFYEEPWFLNTIEEANNAKKNTPKWYVKNLANVPGSNMSNYGESLYVLKKGHFQLTLNPKLKVENKAREIKEVSQAFKEIQEELNNLFLFGDTVEKSGSPGSLLKRIREAVSPVNLTMEKSINLNTILSTALNIPEEDIPNLIQEITKNEEIKRRLFENKDSQFYKDYFEPINKSKESLMDIRDFVGDNPNPKVNIDINSKTAHHIDFYRDFFSQVYTIAEESADNLDPKVIEGLAALKEIDGIKRVSSSVPQLNQLSRQLGVSRNAAVTLYQNNIFNKYLEFFTGENSVIDKYVETLFKPRIDIEVGGKASYPAILTLSDKSLSELAGVDIGELTSDNLDRVRLNELIPESTDFINAREDLKGATTKVQFKQYYKEKVRVELQRILYEDKEVLSLIEKIARGEIPIERLNTHLNNISNKVLLALKGDGPVETATVMGSLRHHFGGMGKAPTRDISRPIIQGLKNLRNVFKSVIEEGDEELIETISAVTEKGVRANRYRAETPNITNYVDPELAEEIRKEARAFYEFEDNTKVSGRTWKGLFVTFEIFQVINDAVESVNILAAFSRLSASYTQQSMTLAQRKNLAGDAGLTFNSVLLSVLSTIVVETALVGVNLGAAALGLGVAPLLAGVALGAVALGVGTYVLLGEEGRKNFVRGVSDTSMFISNAAGGAIHRTGEFVNKNLGAVAARGFTSAVGGGLGGALFGLALSTLSIIQASVAAGALVVSLGGIATGVAIGATIGAVGMGLLGIFAPQTTANILTGAIGQVRRFKLGGFKPFEMLTNQKGDWNRMQNIAIPMIGTEQFDDSISPATASDAIQMDAAAQDSSMDDTTGAAAINMFLPPNLRGGNYHKSKVAEHYSGVLKISPGSMIDPFLQRQLEQKGQLFNQSISGRQLWNKILRTALNKRQIEEAILENQLQDSTAVIFKENLEQANSSVSLPMSINRKRRESFEAVNNRILAKGAEIIRISKTNMESKRNTYDRGHLVTVKAKEVEVTMVSKKYYRDLGLNPKNIDIRVRGNKIDIVAAENNELKEAAKSAEGYLTYNNNDALNLNEIELEEFENT